MLTENNFFDYQHKMVFHQCTHTNSMLWAEMGLGKTIAALTAAAKLIECEFLKGVLVVAPLRVCQLVWEKEARKWAHTQHLAFSYVTGTKDQRIRSLMRKADIYLINYENLRWLTEVLVDYCVNKKKPFQFDGLIWDEVTKMKNSTSKRAAAFRKVLHNFKWITGLTGSPASNGYKDLHGQYLMVDHGQRLGEYKTPFMTRYYHKEGFKDIAFQNAENEIKARISDITLEMSAADYNPLPDMIVNDIEIEFTPGLRSDYEQLEEEFFLKLDSGEELELFNKVSLMNKLLQFSNGAVYITPGQPDWSAIHDLKLKALEDIIEGAQGNQVLCSYAYKSDAVRIMNKFKKLRPINLTACKSRKSLVDAMNRWQAGDCQLMIGHPASMGHGIDGLQDAGFILVWYGMTWSLDLHDQFNARIRRQGQGRPVMCHRIITPDTVDMIQISALSDKATTELALKKAVHDYRMSKGGGKEIPSMVNTAINDVSHMFNAVVH